MAEDGPAAREVVSERRCRGCGAELLYRDRGRPRTWCKDCEIAAKKAAYYEEHKAEIAAKQAAYYEESRTCNVCDERLCQPSADGLCGFCREEFAA